MEQFVVETGNGVAVGIKTDRIVLGNGTQDSRCRYFCIIAGRLVSASVFFLKKMEDRVTARIPIRMYFRYFLI